MGNTPKQSFLSLWFFSFWGPACVQVLCWFVTILKRPYDPRIPREHFISSKKLQISKMCASLIIGKSALEIFRSKIKLRCHFKQPIKRNGFLSSGHPNMITKIKQEKRNLFLSFFSTNVFFLKNTPGHQKSLHPVFEARPDSDPETAAWMVPYLRSASGLLGPRVKGPFEK